MIDATDSLGVRLFRDNILEIWDEEKRHCVCLQDPPGIQLYTCIGQLKKGGIELPVYRCGR